MATEAGFIAYIMEQLNGLPYIDYKKMFGEYMIYSQGRPIFLVCDNTCFVKIIPVTTEFLGEDCEKGYPYTGARQHYIVDIDNRDMLIELAQILTATIPLPKKRNK
ncbi:MAG: transcriptional regulator [Clostridia bacterium]|nr:transcriptional regulator [Clostridia bacterium]